MHVLFSAISRYEAAVNARARAQEHARSMLFTPVVSPLKKNTTTPIRWSWTAAHNSAMMNVI